MKISALLIGQMNIILLKNDIITIEIISFIYSDIKYWTFGRYLLLNPILYYLKILIKDYNILSDIKYETVWYY